MRKDENGRDIYVIYDTSMAYFTPFFFPSVASSLHLLRLIFSITTFSHTWHSFGSLLCPFGVLQETCEGLNVLHLEFPLQ